MHAIDVYVEIVFSSNWWDLSFKDQAAVRSTRDAFNEE